MDAIKKILCGGLCLVVMSGCVTSQQLGNAGDAYADGELLGGTLLLLTTPVTLLVDAVVTPVALLDVATDGHGADVLGAAGTMVAQSGGGERAQANAAMLTGASAIMKGDSETATTQINQAASLVANQRSATQTTPAYIPPPVAVQTYQATPPMLPDMNAGGGMSVAMNGDGNSSGGTFPKTTDKTTEPANSCVSFDGGSNNTSDFINNACNQAISVVWFANDACSGGCMVTNIPAHGSKWTGKPKMTSRALYAACVSPGVAMAPLSGPSPVHNNWRGGEFVCVYL
jgi:hypothetical protein